jgi:hypothetical protein
MFVIKNLNKNTCEQVILCLCFTNAKVLGKDSCAHGFKSYDLTYTHIKIYEQNAGS